MTVDGNADLRRAQAIIVAVLKALPDMRVESYSAEQVVPHDRIVQYSTHGIAAVVEEGHITVAHLAAVAEALRPVLNPEPVDWLARRRNPGRGVPPDHIHLRAARVVYPGDAHGVPPVPKGGA